MAERFDHALFWQTANELYDRLEELHAIDAILDVVDERNLEDLYYPPSNMGGPYNTFLDLGTTYPFRKMIRAVDVTTTTPGYPASAPSTRSVTPMDFGWIDAAYQAASTWRVTAQGHLGAGAEPLLRIESSRFRDVSFAVVDLYATVETTIRQDWSGLKTQSSEWEGHAADTFFANFEVPFGDVVESHKFALDYLNSLICAIKACNDAGQLSLLTLVEEGLRLADDQLRKRAADSRDSSLAAFALLGSTITGIAAAISFPVPGAAAVLGGASVLLNHAASSLPAGATEDREIEASSAVALEQALSTEITQLKENVRLNLDGVDHEVDRMDRHVDNLKEPVVVGSPVNAWVPIQPDIGPGPDFHHESVSH